MLGSLGAWYETQVLIGPLPPGGMLAGMLCGVVYFILAIAVAAVASALVRSTIGAVGIALGLLILLPIASAIPDRQLAAERAGGRPGELVNGSYQLPHYGPALAVSVVAVVAALAAAVRLRRREI